MHLKLIIDDSVIIHSVDLMGNEYYFHVFILDFCVCKILLARSCGCDRSKKKMSFIIHRGFLLSWRIVGCNLHIPDISLFLRMMGTNYLGAFSLTKVLLPLLENSPVPSRIVNVTSFTHRTGEHCLTSLTIQIHFTFITKIKACVQKTKWLFDFQSHLHKIVR